MSPEPSVVNNTLSTTAILLVLALGTFILGLSEFSMMPMLPLFSETFASTPAQSGYTISAYAIGVVIGAPFFMITTANMRKRNALLLFVSMMFILKFRSSFFSKKMNFLLF